jgi:6-phosphogluconolactonase (cycloisomerase 2 family)
MAHFEPTLLRRLFIIFGFSGLVIQTLSCGQISGYGNGAAPITRDYLYVGNFGSSSIATFLIEKNGSLTRSADTSSTGEGTANINAIVAERDANQASDTLLISNSSTNNVSSYSISKFFDPAPSAVTLKSILGSMPGANSLMLNPVYKFGYALKSSSTSNNVFVFTHNRGSLVNVGTFSARTNPSSITVHSTGQFVYVTNQATNDISAFQVNTGTGQLTSVPGQPFAAGVSPVSSVIGDSGQRLYVVNQGSSNVSGYSIDAATGTLTNLGLSASLGAGAKNMTISPGEKYLYVTNQTANSISAFSILSNGNLVAISGSPFSVAGQTTPSAITMSLDGQFLFVAWSGTKLISVFSIDQATGALTVLETLQEGGTQPRSMLVVRLQDRG